MAAKPKYFRGFDTYWNTEDVLPEGSKDERLLALARQIEDTRRERALALSVQISRDLYEVRLTLASGKSWIRSFGITFATNPRPGFEVQVDASLWTDVKFDPRDFLNMPDDPEIIGERLIAATEEGVRKLKEYEGFPADLILSSCETYRQNNYVTHYGTKKGSIEGTPLKTRLDVFVDPLTTRRDLCVLHRGKPLLSTTVSHLDEVDWTSALALHSVELNGETLTYRPISQEQLDWWHKVIGPRANNPFFQPVQIDLKEFPGALAQMRDKGWIKG